MRTLTILFTLFSGPAMAHVGHLGEYAGHDHWVAGAAIGLALGLGLWGALKGKKEKTEEPEASDDAPEEEGEYA